MMKLFQIFDFSSKPYEPVYLPIYVYVFAFFRSLQPY